jgi:hypothetical protein
MRPFVPEQLGLEQRFGNRRTVDRHKRSVSTRAEGVHCAREEFLAGAALAFDEHGGVACGSAVKGDGDLFQPRVLSDNLRGPSSLRELFLEEDVLRRQAPLRESAFDEEQQVVGIDGLGQEVERPLLHRGDRILNAAVSRHHDDRQIGIDFLRCPEDAETVALGKTQVREDHAGAARAKRRNRFGLVARFDDFVALRLEREAEHRAERVLVLDEQDGRIGRTSCH